MRRVGIAAALAWLITGLAGARAYVREYDAHRGFGAPRTPPGIPQGTLRVVAFHSAAIGRTERYLVYLPPGYAAAAARGARFPVLYLLHGAPGKMTSFTDVGAAQVAANVEIARHQIRPLLLVMPAALQGLHADTEWADSPAGRWMDDVVDVVHDADRRFATLRRRADRGIGGDSEGAYGAVNVALHHLTMFSVVESWSGYYWQTRSTVFANSPAAAIEANSPAAEVRRLGPPIRRLGLRAYLYEGRGDVTDPAQMLHFAAHLRADGARVVVRFFPGGHDWALWRAQTPRMLAVASRWLAPAA
jgi:enterochelin esterase-like enzyme